MPCGGLVCVVDDDEEVRRSLAMLLASIGARVRCFESGEAFLAFGEIAAASCVLIDFRMPEMDGFELIDEMHARGLTLPSIVMTGHGKRQVEQAAGALDIQHVLEKPFSMEELQYALETAAGPAKYNGRHPKTRRL